MITREALHKRFTEDGVNFLKSCFEKALKLCSSNTRDNAFKGFKPFSRVCIWDSSGWHLPDSLKAKLRGNGGSSSDAGCKLQFCYDAKSSSIVHCDVTDGYARSEL